MNMLQMDMSFAKEKSSKYGSDGWRRTLAGVVRFLTFLLEYKNEAGRGGCDPVTQMAITYLKQILRIIHEYQEKGINLQSYTCFPVFALTMNGPELCISGMV
jgi:hypothetical protein